MNLFLILAFASLSHTPTAIDFDTDVLPVITKAGCNAAACHGAAAGRGGFKLSLFGGDPAHDYDEIVNRLEGRRVNLSKPTQSLIVLKPTGELDHEGGIRLDESDAETISDWIRAGAMRQQLRRLVSLDVTPNDVIVSRFPDKVELKVEATFNDGTRRNVTREAIFYPTDPAAVQADENGKLSVRRRGRHAVVVRFLTKVRTVQLTVPLHDELVDLSKQPRNNWIDDEILATLEVLRLPPSPQADDATGLRRARLRLTGRLPLPGEVIQYMAASDPKKYQKLVNQLLRSKEFTDYWTYEFAKLLRIRSQPKEQQGALAFHQWVRQQIENKTPLNKVAVDLLTAEGDTHTNGPANFYRATKGPRDQAEYVSEVLMGVRLRCANCHNHPLDRWTQDDYHGLSAIFARIEQGRIIRVASRGEVTHPRTGQAALPRIPGQRFLNQDEDARQSLADWLLEDDNPQFAKAMVNRLWRAMMGRGLIEPTDDLRATNPATHPKLLDRITQDFVEHNYDIRHTLRLIALSAAFKRSHVASERNRADDRFCSRAIRRPLEAEVLLDAVVDVTGVSERYDGQPVGTRAVTLFNPKISSQSLDVLGRCSREDSCESSGTSAGGITQKLHLINGALINAKITAKSGRLRNAIDSGKSNSQIVNEFYLRVLGRPATHKEQTYWKQQLAADGAGERRERLEDFLWSLLSSREFSMN